MHCRNCGHDIMQDENHDYESYIHVISGNERCNLDGVYLTAYPWSKH